MLSLYSPYTLYTCLTLAAITQRIMLGGSSCDDIGNVNKRRVRLTGRLSRPALPTAQRRHLNHPPNPTQQSGRLLRGPPTRPCSPCHCCSDSLSDTLSPCRGPLLPPCDRRCCRPLARKLFPSATPSRGEASRSVCSVDSEPSRVCIRPMSRIGPRMRSRRISR